MINDIFITSTVRLATVEDLNEMKSELQGDLNDMKIELQDSVQDLKENVPQVLDSI